MIKRIITCRTVNKVTFSFMSNLSFSLWLFYSLFFCLLIMVNHFITSSLHHSITLSLYHSITLLLCHFIFTTENTEDTERFTKSKRVKEKKRGGQFLILSSA